MYIANSKITTTKSKKKKKVFYMLRKERNVILKKMPSKNHKGRKRVEDKKGTKDSK